MEILKIGQILDFKEKLGVCNVGQWKIHSVTNSKKNHYYKMMINHKKAIHPIGVLEMEELHKAIEDGVVLLVEEEVKKVRKRKRGKK